MADPSLLLRETPVHPRRYPARAARAEERYLHEHPGVPFSQQPKLHRGVFSILLTSTVMTIFEIVFFIVVINPTTKGAINGLLSGLSSFLDNTPLPVPEAIKNAIAGLFVASANQESQLVAQTNQYALITAWFFVALLMLFLFLLDLRMRRLGHNLSRVRYFGIDFNATVLTSALTVSLLMFFQIIFYFFGVGFQFEGTKGTEELQHAFNNQLRRDKGLQPIRPY